MYKLFTNQTINSTLLKSDKIILKLSNIKNFHLENNLEITLIVPEFVEPDKWLFQPFSCIVWYKLKTSSDRKEGLEIFIDSPIRVGKLYALGEETIILNSKTDTIELYKDTIDMLLQRSIYCDKPFIYPILHIDCVN